MLRLKLTLTLAAALLTAPIHAGAKADACPALNINGVELDDGSLIIALAMDPVPAGMTFDWAVSAGEISEGQGTQTIVVKAPVGTVVTATVLVGGIDPVCQDAVSYTIDVI